VTRTACVTPGDTRILQSQENYAPDQARCLPGLRHARGGLALRITREDGLITVEQAAELCGVKPVTVRNWASRGYGPRDARRRLAVARRENGLMLLDPIEVAKADHATKGPARRSVIRLAAA
jgi:predicted transcriptional regulator of viral defense system